MKPRLLDLFCGAGGAAVGYARAGFEVVGVDINPQKRYPFEFIQADAMTFPLDGFDFIHASPPCQRYSIVSRGMGIADRHVDLVDATRERLVESGANWVIENVPGAPMYSHCILCGSMFGLGSRTGGWLRRHRLFETRDLILGVPECTHPKDSWVVPVYGHGTNKYHMEILGRSVTVEEKREAMGIDWMNRDELNQAIPPAYTEWIGRRLK